MVAAAAEVGFRRGRLSEDKGGLMWWRDRSAAMAALFVNFVMNI